VLTDSANNNHRGKIVNAKWVPGIAAGPPAAKVGQPDQPEEDQAGTLHSGGAEHGEPMQHWQRERPTLAAPVLFRAQSRAARIAVSSRELIIRVCFLGVLSIDRLIRRDRLRFTLVTVQALDSSTCNGDRWGTLGNPLMTR
jgi:hypothetical protein